MIKAVTGRVFALVLLLLPSTGLAQGIPGTDDPDFKEIVAYRLTMPAVQKMGQVMRNLAATIKDDPRYIKQQTLETEIKKLEAKEEPTEADSEKLEKLRADLDALEESTSQNFNNAKTLSEMAAALNSEPLFRKALADAGVDARELSKFLFAYFQAGIIHGFMKSGVFKEVPKELAGTVNMDNVKFIAEHEAELEAFGKEMEALNPKPKQE